MQISTLVNSQNILGEAPLWHIDRHSIFWVDIEQELLNEFSLVSGQVTSWSIGRKVSLIIKSEDSSLILGVQGGLVRFNLDTAAQIWVSDLERNIPDRRCNDGGIDPQGRFWIGVMDVHAKPGVGSLYRLDDPNMAPVRVLSDLTIPNGLVWSLDYTIMYFIDTLSQKIRAYRFDGSNGTITYEKDAVVIPESLGLPDGMTIDEEGMLWVALYGGGAVTRWDPNTGDMLSLIKMPALNITNCCFVGSELNKLVVTSARENMSPDQLDAYPESGNLFMIEGLGVNGARIATYKANAT